MTLPWSAITSSASPAVATVPWPKAAAATNVALTTKQDRPKNIIAPHRKVWRINRAGRSLDSAGPPALLQVETGRSSSIGISKTGPYLVLDRADRQATCPPNDSELVMRLQPMSCLLTAAWLLAGGASPGTAKDKP